MDFKKWLLPVLLMLASIAYIVKSKKKPVRRRKKKTSSVRSSPGSNKTSVSRKMGKPNMPKMYQTGCKGKKGKQLGQCLQWWRKYRSGKATKK